MSPIEKLMASVTDFQKTAEELGILELFPNFDVCVDKSGAVWLPCDALTMDTDNPMPLQELVGALMAVVALLHPAAVRKP